MNTLRRRPIAWKARVEQLVRIRRCVPYDLGRAYICETPWQPGDSALYERMGPERRPCPLCEVHYVLSEVIANGIRAEVEEERRRQDEMPYRAHLEADRDVMRKVKALEVEVTAHAGADACALHLLHKHGSVEAALEELEDDAYAVDADYWSAVRTRLGWMAHPYGEVIARSGEGATL